MHKMRFVDAKRERAYSINFACLPCVNRTGRNVFCTTFFDVVMSDVLYTYGIWPSMWRLDWLRIISLGIGILHTASTVTALMASSGIAGKRNIVSLL